MTAVTTSPARATMTNAPPPATDNITPGARLAVEYWTVTMNDQNSCGSCDATLAALREATDQIQPLAARLGIAIEIQTRTITTWAQAIDHAIAASPTIRATGQELRPTHPDHTEKRVWQWRGTRATLPVEALTDLLVRALAARSQQIDDYVSRGGPAPYIRQYLPAAQPASPTPEITASGSGCA